MSYVKAAYSLTNISDPITQMRALVQWLNQELTKLEDGLRIPELRGIQFEQLYAVPPKFAEGDLYYFAAGVPGAPGLFIRDTGNWRKL